MERTKDPSFIFGTFLPENFFVASFRTFQQLKKKISFVNLKFDILKEHENVDV